MNGQRTNICRALAQRRHGERHDIQPIKQIFAKAALGHGLLEIEIGDGDDAQSRRQNHCLATSQAIETPLFNDAQQFGLHGRRKGGNLIEDQGAGAGQLQAPTLHLSGAGKGTGLVAEQLALHELVGQAGTIDLEQRLGGVWAEIVQHGGK